MSRGADDMFREYLMRDGFSRDHAQWMAEELVEALEAEDYWPVHRDCTLMMAPDYAVKMEYDKRKKRNPDWGNEENTQQPGG